MTCVQIDEVVNAKCVKTITGRGMPKWGDSGVACGEYAPSPPSSAAIFRADVAEMNRQALDKDTDLPFFWAYVDSADCTSMIVKVNREVLVLQMRMCTRVRVRASFKLSSRQPHPFLQAPMHCFYGDR